MYAATLRDISNTLSMDDEARTILVPVPAMDIQSARSQSDSDERSYATSTIADGHIAKQSKRHRRIVSVSPTPLARPEDEQEAMPDWINEIALDVFESTKTAPFPFRCASCDFKNSMNLPLNQTKQTTVNSESARREREESDQITGDAFDIHIRQERLAYQLSQPEVLHKIMSTLGTHVQSLQGLFSRKQQYVQSEQETERSQLEERQDVAAKEDNFDEADTLAAGQDSKTQTREVFHTLFLEKAKLLTDEQEAYDTAQEQHFAEQKHQRQLLTATFSVCNVLFTFETVESAILAKERSSLSTASRQLQYPFREQRRVSTAEEGVEEMI
ncbi:hypothetical protein BLNAU_14200 [Blattamonas nauphoetae]|uniref:Uncharacterized protein n=1 Tax=Blattamonas nauphoetae TaxID=2049346 RepID=A0ABQ9XHV4_9EUKA|nr:hypothetical protein BLNAU_14200 [Blattamonas nauphoetae]